MDLHLALDPALGRRHAVEDALRASIRAGTLVPGARLPSSRALAAELGLARATVVGAYEQLISEGYLSARHGSGTRVASARSQPASPTRAKAAAPRLVADFRPGEPDLSLFPRSEWLAAVRTALRAASTDTLGYGDPRGSIHLREALASYLGRTRAVAADPGRIFVFSGFADALATLARVLARVDGRTVVVEEPCLPLHPTAIERAGASVHPVAVDQDGLVVDELSGLDAGSVLTAPAHQYPLGVTLTAERRSALVEWARAVDGWIVEDDYDGEFRYDRQPVGSLQGLAPDRVVYAGSASKSIAPGIGIGWLVVPAPLVDPLADHLRLHITTSPIAQAALAHFIEAGRLDHHLRRMRPLYRRRRDRLVAMLASSAPHLAITGIAAGLHVTALGMSATQEADVAARADAARIGVLRLGVHYRGAPTATGLVIGYSRPAEHAFSRSLERLSAFLQSIRAD